MLVAVNWSSKRPTDICVIVESPESENLDHCRHLVREWRHVETGEVKHAEDLGVIPQGLSVHELRDPLLHIDFDHH